MSRGAPPRGNYPPMGYPQQAPGAINHAFGPRGAPPPMGMLYGRPQSPPPNVKPELWKWFQMVDTDHSGEITVEELQQVLVNGNWSQFNAETCRLMIGMFDRNNSGGIDVDEFAALWEYIENWKSCFDRYDTDKSGNIDAGELQQAFQSFGYNLSPDFVKLCLSVFDRNNSASMNFDDFIQCSVMVKSLTDQFRSKDTQQKGVLRIHYEEFLSMVLNSNNVI